MLLCYIRAYVNDPVRQKIYKRTMKQDEIDYNFWEDTNMLLDNPNTVLYGSALYFERKTKFSLTDGSGKIHLIEVFNN